MANRKKAAAAAAVAVAAALVLGGTFAWQSISQTALNELSGKANPGGRLHDIFDGNIVDGSVNKDVFVENFTEFAKEGQNVYARVRLDEFMEVGKGAGVEGGDATSLVDGATFEDKGSWTPRVHEDYADVYYAGFAKDGDALAGNPFEEFWIWSMGSGEDPVIYVPTFNKDKDSLAADVKSKSDYEANAVVEGTAVYDDDEDALPNENGQGKTKTVLEWHAAEELPDAEVITMTEWMLLPETSEDASETTKSNFAGWVWDADGWAYWSQPIAPQGETGLLLDGLERTETGYIGDDWYYGINVVAQFVTYDDIGIADDTGFYDPEAGAAPSDSALTLLDFIGVEVGTAVTGDNLRLAIQERGVLNLGGETIALANFDELTINAPNGGTATFGLVMSEGGSISNGTITSDIGAYASLFVNNELDWPEAGDGAAAAFLNNLTVGTGSDSYAVYVQAVDADVTMNRVTATNTYGGAIYAEHGSSKVTLNDCTATAATVVGEAADWVHAAVAAANGANVEVNGGTYTGKYAAYVYSTGGTITINGGTFTGDLRVDAGSIVIKGGTFSVDPTAFVSEEGYEVTDNGDGTWTVTAVGGGGPSEAALVGASIV